MPMGETYKGVFPFLACNALRVLRMLPMLSCPVLSGPAEHKAFAFRCIFSQCIHGNIRATMFNQAAIDR